DIIDERNLEQSKAEREAPETKEKVIKKNSIESLISDEVEKIKKTVANKNKMAIEILFGDEKTTRLHKSQTEIKPISPPERALQNQKASKAPSREGLKDLAEETEDIILKNAE